MKITQICSNCGSCRCDHCRSESAPECHTCGEETTVHHVHGSNCAALVQSMATADTLSRLTPAQTAALSDVIQQHGAARLKAVVYNNLNNYLAVQFDTIYIGIEPDGYCHT